VKEYGVARMAEGLQNFAIKGTVRVHSAEEKKRVGTLFSRLLIYTAR
jgi:hypothetical protein